MKIKMINLILVPTYRKLIGIKNHVFYNKLSKRKRNVFDDNSDDSTANNNFWKLIIH